MAVAPVLFLRTLMFVLTLRLCIAKGCFAELGTNINPRHCAEAMKSLSALVSYASRGGQPHDQVWYSRNPALVGIFRHLPKSFVFGTCSIGIDLSDTVHGPPSDGTGLPASWAVFAREVQSLVGDCVNRHGWGGWAAYEDFEFLVVNPLAGISEGTCLTPHRPHGMSLSQCVSRQIDAKQRQARLSAHQQPPPPPPQPSFSEVQLRPHLSGMPPVVAPPSLNAQVHGARLPAAGPGAGPAAAAQQQQPAPQHPAAELRVYSGGLHGAAIAQQLERTRQQQALIRVAAQAVAQQQNSDRRAQREAMLQQNPTWQQVANDPPPVASQPLGIAPPQTGVPSPGPNPPASNQPGQGTARLLGYHLLAHLHAQQPRPAGAGPSRASSDPTPTPGSPTGSGGSSRSGSKRPNSDSVTDPE